MPTKKTVTETVNEKVHEAKDEAVETTKDLQADLADRVDHEAEALSHAGVGPHDDSYARQAADQISATLTQLAGAVRSADLETVQSDITAFARRNPAVFFGGAAVLGFLAGRALKASDRAEAAQTFAHDPDPAAAYPNAQRAMPSRSSRPWGYS